VYYQRAHSSVPLPDYSAALYSLYVQSGKTGRRRKQLDLIDIVDRLAQAGGEKTTVSGHDLRRPGPPLDHALELAREELKCGRILHV